MLEVVFCENAAASLLLAMRHADTIGHAVSICVLADGEPPAPAEVQRIQEQADARERENWKRAVPFPGQRADIFCFPLALSVGSIDEDGIGPAREQALRMLTGSALGDAQRVTDRLAQARERLDALRCRAAQGEPLRVWSSDSPDEACGLCWLMDQLAALGLHGLDVTLVRLPLFDTGTDGAAVSYTSWGEVQPYRWGRLAALGQKLPMSYLHGLADRWQTLRRENMPLRAVLNGQLVSMPETLYDPFILREADAQQAEFHEAQVVGRVLGRYQLGIGDMWVAGRMEQFVQDGLFETVTQPGPQDLSYRRILRKRGI